MLCPVCDKKVMSPNWETCEDVHCLQLLRYYRVYKKTYKDQVLMQIKHAIRLEKKKIERLEAFIKIHENTKGKQKKIPRGRKGFYAIHVPKS
jgi:hypothetical protein